MNENVIKYINENKLDNVYIKYFHKNSNGKEKIFIKKPYKNYEGKILVNSNYLVDVYIIDISSSIFRLIDLGELLDKNGEIHIIDPSRSLYAKASSEMA